MINFIPSQERKCLNCNDAIRADSQRRKFCSESCNHRYSSKLFNKRHKKTCPVCQKNKMSHNAKSCRECDLKSISCDELTLADYHAKYPDKHPSWKNAEIRNFARNWNKHLKVQPCQKCGYSNHIEFCHIKAISSFPQTAKLKEINKEENLLVLCPNHHWELDNGILSIEEIPKRKMTDSRKLS
jgi:hypothetical protein